MKTTQKLTPDTKKFIRLCQKYTGSLFTPNSPVFINRAPGRLDLMGGNDDYTGGLVFETTIKEATFFAAQPRQDGQFILLNPSVRQMGWHEQVEFSMDDLATPDGMMPIEQLREWINNDPKSNWIATLVGNLYYLKLNHPAVVKHGLSMLLDSDIPLGKGVSSSAALEAAGMKACAAAYGIETKGVDLAIQTQWVENAIAQSASGVMDQFAVVMGDANTFTPMLCQQCIPYPRVKLPRGLAIWGIDSGVRHSVAGIEYEAARAATFMGYQYICEMEGLPVKRDDTGVLSRYFDPKWDGYLARLSPTEFRMKYEEKLPESISGSVFIAKHPVHFDPYTPVRDEVDYPVRKSTRYSVEENQRVKMFFELLKSTPTPVSDQTLDLLGELMYGAHAGYTDCGLGTKETDLLVELVQARRGKDLFGAKITGGGAGGTVAILGRNTLQANEAISEIIAAYRQQTGIEPYLFTGSSQGADAFGVMVI